MGRGTHISQLAPERNRCGVAPTTEPERPMPRRTPANLVSAAVPGRPGKPGRPRRPRRVDVTRIWTLHLPPRRQTALRLPAPLFRAGPLSKVVTSPLQSLAGRRFRPAAEATCLPLRVGGEPTFLGPVTAAHTADTTLPRFSGSCRVYRIAGSKLLVCCSDHGLQPLDLTFAGFPCDPFGFVAKTVDTPLMDFGPSTGLPNSSPGLIPSSPLSGVRLTRHPLLRFLRPSSALSTKRPPFYSRLLPWAASDLRLLPEAPRVCITRFVPPSPFHTTSAACSASHPADVSADSHSWGFLPSRGSPVPSRTALSPAPSSTS